MDHIRNAHVCGGMNFVRNRTNTLVVIVVDVVVVVVVVVVDVAVCASLVVM